MTNANRPHFQSRASPATDPVPEGSFNRRSPTYSQVVGDARGGIGPPRRLGVALVTSPAAAAGKRVRLPAHAEPDRRRHGRDRTSGSTGINWFGMETDNHTFHGLWAERDLEVHDRPHGPARATTPSGCRTPATRSGPAPRPPASTRHQPRPGRPVAAADPGQGRRLRRHARDARSSSTGTARPPPGRPRSGTPPRSPRRA